MNDFGWALAQMRAGKKVRRPHWRTDEWITVEGDKIVDDDGARTHFASQEPLMATDWQVVE